MNLNKNVFLLSFDNRQKFQNIVFSKNCDQNVVSTYNIAITANDLENEMQQLYFGKLIMSIARCVFRVIL